MTRAFALARIFIGSMRFAFRLGNHFNSSILCPAKWLSAERNCLSKPLCSAVAEAVFIARSPRGVAVGRRLSSQPFSLVPVVIAHFPQAAFCRTIPCQAGLHIE